MRKTLSTILSIILLTASIVLSGCASAKSQNSPTDNAVVSTQAGKIRGSVTKSGVLSFKGVPYAEANERFVPAKPVAKWEGVRDATEFGKISPQMKFMSSNMLSDEISDNNCQNLNIWTPGLDKKKRAVRVWLHGGGFIHFFFCIFHCFLQKIHLFDDSWKIWYNWHSLDCLQKSLTIFNFFFD